VKRPYKNHREIKARKAKAKRCNPLIKTSFLELCKDFIKPKESQAEAKSRPETALAEFRRKEKDGGS
jgi:hypothetical protein